MRRRIPLGESLSYAFFGIIAVGLTLSGELPAVILGLLLCMGLVAALLHGSMRC